jgi:methionyl-tRNA formyltransferase
VRSGKAPRIEQDHGLATYCTKRTPDDGLIDWREPAAAILRLVRAAGEPYPGAFTTCGDHRLIVDAATPFADSDRHIGLPGQVQCHTPQGFAVRCGDGRCIHISAWRQDQGAGKPHVDATLGASSQ